MKVIWSPIYEIERSYFKGKIWVLYKLKTKTSGKGYRFEIIVLLISVTAHGFVRHFQPHNHKCQSDNKRGNLSVQVTPKISYQQIYFDETSLGGNTVIRFSILPLQPPTLKIKNSNVILTKFKTRFTDLIMFQHVET